MQKYSHRLQVVRLILRMGFHCFSCPPPYLPFFFPAFPVAERPTTTRHPRFRSSFVYVRNTFLIISTSSTSPSTSLNYLNSLWIFFIPLTLSLSLSFSLPVSFCFALFFFFHATLHCTL